MSKITPVKMDSRKFLSAINGGEQAKIALFENKVQELGRSRGRAWKLASLGATQLYIEDTQSNDYFLADYRREKGNRFIVNNVRPVQIVESEKRGIFAESCRQLINSIEENDQKGMAAAFDKMSAQRFSSRAVPVSGVVRTRDGAVRNIKISNGQVVPEGARARLESAIIEALTDHVLVEGSEITGIEFSGRKIRLPVNEWTCRRAVARSLKTVAESAYKSEGFQDRIATIAALVEKVKIEEAVKIAKPFFAEEQEFCMLTRGEMLNLVENTLAARGVFNQSLCNDTARLLHRTNLEVNKASIVKEWKATAKKAGNMALVENVMALAQSKDFSATYDKFLDAVFQESMSSKDVRRDTYVMALKMLQGTPRIKGSADLAGQINGLIENLENPADDAALIEAENLLASVKSHLTNEGLNDFDEMPGDPSQSGGTGGDDLGLDDDAGVNQIGDLVKDGAEEEGEEKKPATTVNFNITIGGDGGVDVGGLGDEAGGGDDMDLGGGDEGEGGDDIFGGGDDMGGDGGEGGGGDDLGLGGGDEDQDQQKGFGESRRRRKAVNEEWEKPWLKKDDKDGEEKKDDEDDSEEKKDDDSFDFAEDRYAYKAPAVSGLGLDYGIPPISEGDCSEVANLVLGTKPNGLTESQFRNLIIRAIKESGLMIPRNKIEAAINQVGTAVLEAQRRLPVRRKAGFKKTRLTTQEIKENANDGTITWLENKNGNATGRFNGVVFTVSAPQRAVIGEDGYSIELPAAVLEGTRAALSGKGDTEPLFAFLEANIEQFRNSAPISESDIAEAVAEITNGPDGLTVRVPPGTKIELSQDETQDALPGDDMGGLPGDDMAGDAVIPADESGLPPGDLEGGEEVEMNDVNDDVPPMGEEGGIEGEETPDGAMDFEAEGDIEGEEDGISDEPAPPFKGAKAPKAPKGEPDDDLAEDKDITSPKSAKYNTTTQDHRKPAEIKLPKAAGNKLEGISNGEVKDGMSKTGDFKMEKITPRKS